MKEINAVLFDLGNVLVDLDVRRCFRHWADASGVDIEVLVSRWVTDEHYEDHERGGRNFETYTAALAGNLGIELSLDDWREGWNAIFRDVHADVTSRLPQLADLLPIYCFTNTNPTHQAVWSPRFSDALAPLLKIYVSSEIGLRKPDAHAYRWVVDDMRTRPENVLFLDDNAENVAGAAAVGMQTVLVRDTRDTVAAIEALLDSQ